MKLVVLAGFLGSGKTTLLLRLAAALQARGQRVALVVNEIGDIGIDNRLATLEGGKVWELLSGCICCTLAGNLVQTLAEIEAKFFPDVVILEPSGASQPELILRALTDAGGVYLTGMRWLALVDPLRLEELVAVLEPLMQSNIASADLAIITKADRASGAQMASARNWISGLRPDLRCLVVASNAPERGEGGSAAPLAELLSCL